MLAHAHFTWQATRVAATVLKTLSGDKTPLCRTPHRIVSYVPPTDKYEWQRSGALKRSSETTHDFKRFTSGTAPSHFLDSFVVLFLSRVSTPTRDIDIAILSVCSSVCLSVRDGPVSDENGLTYCHIFSPYSSPIILVLSPSNIFTKFRRDHPLLRWQ